MKLTFLSLICLFTLPALAQNNSTDSSAAPSNSETQKKKSWSQDESAVKVFLGQRLINANTVEVLPKGIMEFRVIHNFGDIAGDNGGIKRFFGLDNAADIKIAFQIGLGKRLNILAARTRGDQGSVGDPAGTPDRILVGELQKLWELGLKYKFLSQEDNAKHPFSLTVFANAVVSSMNSSGSDVFRERTFTDFSDRTSEVVQLMLARKFGAISLQLSPTYVHTNFVVSPVDDKDLFAIGGGMRLPLSKRFFLIADYFHTFRSKESIDFLRSHNISLHDVFGVGFEIVTSGHIFHMNFTNATDILENRFLPRTHTSWGDGEFRWGFTISRNFVLFREKKNN